ncbi:hypothetical protein EMIT0P100_40255 [Pseudomonas sp. IT-P100]
MKCDAVKKVLQQRQRRRVELDHCGEGIYLWRGDLSPLGSEATPKPSDEFDQVYREQWVYGGCAAERG